MWRCVCGNILRSAAHSCNECGRNFNDNARFTDRLQTIELAISLTLLTRVETAETEKLILAHLANDLSLSEIAQKLTDLDNSVANCLARILRNLIT